MVVFVRYNPMWKETLPAANGSIISTALTQIPTFLSWFPKLVVLLNAPFNPFY
jgi:hypothetical protein